jgi:hypothetical protein
VINPELRELARLEGLKGLNASVNLFDSIRKDELDKKNKPKITVSSEDFASKPAAPPTLTENPETLSFGKAIDNRTSISKHDNEDGLEELDGPSMFESHRKR